MSLNPKTKHVLKRAGTIALLGLLFSVSVFAQGPGTQFGNWVVQLCSGSVAKGLSLCTLIGCLMGLHRGDGTHTGKLLTGAIVSGGILAAPTIVTALQNVAQ
jgi:hypothetical protein